MKKFKTVLSQATLIIAVTLTTSSCINNKPEDTKEVAEEHNDAKFEKNDSEKDAQFLVNAAEINMVEISLGKLAQEKGSTNHVKALGKMMEDEHTKSLADLTALAQIKNITLPISQTENGQDAYKKLNGKSGIDFGKAYSDMMVKEHKGAIALFEQASTDASDPDIRNWATEILPVLRTHLDHALICQKECAKM